MQRAILRRRSSPGRHRWRSLGLAAAVGLAVVAASSGCGAAGGGPLQRGRLRVVAAENFWGSIAAQLGGDKVDVQSIIVNPDADPHSYQPTARDARTMAGAGLAIVNGLGYDGWAQRLLSASPSAGRRVLDVGELLHLAEGANPHRWYFPGDVRAVTGAIAAEYDHLDPTDAPYFAARRRTFEVDSLARYDSLREEIRARYAHVPVGYSESIFQGLGEDLNLKLITPYGFAKAIAEGTEVSVQNKRTVDEQAERHQMRVWVFNSQNVSPDVQRVNELAHAAGIPSVAVTETLSPAGDSFQQWQVSELEGLLHALQQAGRR